MLVSSFAFAPELRAQATTVGTFNVVRAADPIDDSNRSYIAAGVAGEAQGGSIEWRCMEDGLNVVLDIGKYFGGDDDDEIQVITRVDQDANSGMVYWPLLQSHTSAYMPMDRVAAFTRRAKTARQIAVRATDPLDGETLTFVFPIEQFDRALSQILPCN
ncbi:MAG TPA: hypothetical protein VKZ41_09010 [Gemmatimonadales bacterium]|nr:hypothetical protein [Gemmatimonadales bacterium]